MVRRLSTVAAKSDLLRLSTAGSVDDGKSTLIGRLLYETKSIFEDQLEAIERTSRDQGADYVNLALLTDGLRAEREQGITIDVAYRYFSTPKRTFILADTPGHVQYTRNMVTGASTSDLAIILVDASRGIMEQSRRHIFIASLLRIRHFVICINKMDLVDYSEEVFARICSAFQPFLTRLGLSDVLFIPVSALHGDNVVEPSLNMPWYEGPSLLHHLENVEVASDQDLVDVRFPVQWVIRPHRSEHYDYRGYAGQVAGGVIKPGDAVVALPGGYQTRVRSIDTFDGPISWAFPPMSVTLTLADEIDISRGDMITGLQNRPIVGQNIEATLCWLTTSPLKVGKKYIVKHTTRSVRAVVTNLQHRIDINSLGRDESAEMLGLNEIGRVSLRTASPLMYDPYDRNRATGGFILIDEGTNETVAAGIIQQPVG
ncbi:MAG TPA: GTP-binding protein [Chloroflexota bacterium]|jgi:bifunctional enzyme CysN/CysC|nr:GTP-binding protein [Chloroflexota bacterium]